MQRIHRHVLAAVFGVLAVAPTVAGAATFEVSGSGADSATCGTSPTPCRTLGFVLNERVTAEPDTIVLAPGEQLSPGLLVTGPNASGDTISGPGATLTHSNAGGDELIKASVPLTIADLALKLPAGAAQTRTALSLVGGSTLRNVSVTVANASTAPSQIAAAGAGLRFDHLSVTGNHTGDALTLDAPTGALVTDSTLRGGTSAAANALYVGNGDALVQRSRLSRDAAAPGLDPVIAAINAKLVVDSSLITGGHVGVNAQSEPGHDGSLTLRGSTVDVATLGSADGGPDNHPVYVRTTMPGIGSQFAHIEHSILVEEPYAFQESGSLAAVDCRDSIVPASSSPLVSCGAEAANEPITGLLFANPGAGDYHPVAGSAAIDGTTVALADGESSTDLDGAPRLTDGDGDCTAAADRGAFELAAAPATCPPAGSGSGTGSGSGAATGLPVLDKVSLSRTRLSRTRSTRLRLRLSVDATVTITVSRVLKHGRTAKAKTLRFHAKAGSRTRAISGRTLKPGIYRVSVVARAGGRSSAVKHVRFVVQRRAHKR